MKSITLALACGVAVSAVATLIAFGAAGLSFLGAPQLLVHGYMVAAVGVLGAGAYRVVVG